MTTDTAVHEIHQRRVRTGTVRTRLPMCSDSWYEPGPVMQHADAVLNSLRETATRCVPGIRVFLGPRLWRRRDADGDDSYTCRPNVRQTPDGEIEYEHHGLACYESKIILVAPACRLPSAMNIIHHEIWYSCEHLYLHPDDIEIVSMSVASGIPQPGAYLDSASERRARQYESWASAVDEGWRPPVLFGWPLRRIDRVYAYVHGGRLARDLARHGAARPQVGVWGLLAQAVAWPPLVLVVLMAVVLILFIRGGVHV